MTDSFAELQTLGWNAVFARAFLEGADVGDIPARVKVVHRDRVAVATAIGDTQAILATTLQRETNALNRPSTGDWVVLRRHGRDLPHIIKVLPRSSAFVRQAAGTTSKPQVVAANVDVVLIVTALPHDFNLRRLERYVTATYESGARPVIVLTKTDLVAETETWIAEARTVAPGVDVVALSIMNRESLDSLEPYMTRGSTLALLGSSGVGKSTLVNRLLERDVMRTSSVDANGRGRHTTAHRELMCLPGGAILIDTPGMRELQPWMAAESLEHTFVELAELSEMCRYSDCTHDTEPGCAVITGLENGSVDAGRLESWRSLRREMRSAEVRQDPAAVIVDRARAKSFERLLRKQMRDRYGS